MSSAAMSLGFETVLSPPVRTVRLQKTDEELMVACRQGDASAFDKLYRRYSGRLYGFISRYTGNSDRAEDLVQETFLRAFSVRESYQPTASFASWIYRIARNLCVDEKRRYWNRKVTLDSQTGTDENETTVLESIPETTPSSREAVADAELSTIINQIIDTLSPEQREVMILSKYEGLSYKEIGDLLGVSTESVKQRAYRAHVKLRAELEPYLEVAS